MNLILASTVPAIARLTIDTSKADDWKISNGVIALDWMPSDGRVFSMHWMAFPDQELIDQSNRDRNGPKGFYMDNAGDLVGATNPGYYVDPNGEYVDFWVAHTADATTPFSWSWHDILFADDPGVHVYFVLEHGPADIPGSIGQIQWVFRGDLTQFTNTYSVNTGLSNLGATIVPLPDAVLFGTTPAGRNVQDATVDLHGLSLPSGYRRLFSTKYDYSSYEYLHQAQGVYGSTLGAWMVVPSSESLTGGPTKQDLIFTGNLLIMEAYSNHLDNQMAFTVPAGATLHRLYGPFYLHFNSLSSGGTSPRALYREALQSMDRLKPRYDREQMLVTSGYVPSIERGDLEISIEGAAGAHLNQAWAVLSDEHTNFQYSHAGPEYWVNIRSDGVAEFRHVVPGRYRLSAYVLGQWGESRLDGVSVKAREHQHLKVAFTPENFSSSPAIWHIGRADRSSHEFLHGQILNPIDLDRDYRDKYSERMDSAIQDDRQYWGNWNYWADFADTSGAVVYYATRVGSIPATRDLGKWNYNQWHVFNPGLFAGIYNPSDDTSDGYKYICPAYVGNCSSAAVPDWQVHFTTKPEPQRQGQSVLLSVGLADTEANLTVSLNGSPLVWHGLGLKNADADVRSGFSGTYQWVVFEWETSQLNPPGADNLLTFHVDRTQGVMYDALRLEIANGSGAHEITGWNDYEYLNSSTYEPANDAVPNNN